MHGGRAPQVKAAAALRLEGAAAERACEELGLAVPVSPAAALLDSLAHAYGRVLYLRRKEAALGDELTWGQTKQVVKTTQAQGGTPGQPTIEIHQEARVSIYTRLLQDAEDRVKAIAEAILRAGVEERQTRVSEVMVAQFSQALDGIFADLHLTAEQVALIPETVPRRLRALGPAA